MTLRHLSWLSVQMCTAGCMASGLSRLAMVISKLGLPATGDLPMQRDLCRARRCVQGKHCCLCHCQKLSSCHRLSSRRGALYAGRKGQSGKTCILQEPASTLRPLPCDSVSTSSASYPCSGRTSVCHIGHRTSAGLSLRSGRSCKGPL